MNILYGLLGIGAYLGLSYLIIKFIGKQTDIFYEAEKILHENLNQLKEAREELYKEVKDLGNLIESQKPRWFNEEDEWLPGRESLEARMARLWRDAYNAENDL